MLYYGTDPESYITEYTFSVRKKALYRETLPLPSEEGTTEKI